ncbi:SBBP repeat-containing protein [Chloroflexota bacterium]
MFTIQNALSRMIQVTSKTGVVVIVVALLATMVVSSPVQNDANADIGQAMQLNLADAPIASKSHPKMESSLSQLAAQYGEVKVITFAEQHDIQIEDSMIRVILEVNSIENTTQILQKLGIVLEGIYSNLVQVLAPVSTLEFLANQESVDYVRLPQRPVPDAIISEGVGLIGADGFGYTGGGIKVAVIDLGFQGYTSLLGTELPSSVTINSFRADQDIEAGEIHGTGCAEIIYDVAPDAQLYLVNIDTEVELASAVTWLISQGVDVISCSLGFLIGGPGDGTGSINDIVSTAKANGILWVNSAGNYGDKHWSGQWSDTDADSMHNFLLEDETNHFYANAEETIALFLRWDDPWGASPNDYELFLFYENDLTSPIAWSTREQSGTQDPVEALAVQAPSTGAYHIVITEYSSSRAVNFNLLSAYHTLAEYKVIAGSLSVPADSANAIAVGAVYWNNPGTIRNYSSQGPTKDSRPKPDIVAPDGVSNYSYTSFTGTSASAPHVAGAAALVKQQYPNLTPGQIQAYLEGYAIDLGSLGKDNIFGSGRLNISGMDKSPSWVSIYNSPYNSGDLSYAVAVDDLGNIYITGASTNSGSNSDYTTIKYDSAGTQLWVARYDGTAGGSDWAYDIAVDSSGNVYVTGQSYGIGTELDLVTVKYDNDGNELWVARYDGPMSGNDSTRGGLVLDALGNIYVVGSSQGNGHDYITIKYNSAGTQLWYSRYDGPASNEDWCKAVALDDSGNVYVTGQSYVGSTYNDYATIKYDGAGNQIWVAHYNGPGTTHDYAEDIDLDSSGNVFVTGQSQGTGTNDDYATIKYDNDGNQIWVARYDGPANAMDGANAMVIDSLGNIFVTGHSQGIGTNDDYATIKYDNDGNQVWVARHDGPAHASDRAEAIAVDAWGNIFVTGESYGEEDNITTIAYLNEGGEFWISRYSNFRSVSNEDIDIAVDTLGNAYATGCIRRANGDYATIKYGQEGGLVAEFEASSPSGPTALDVQFTDTSPGIVFCWAWDFGDGGTSTEQNPTHIYQDAGAYTVALTVTGRGGSDTKTKDNYILAYSIVTIPDDNLAAAMRDALGKSPGDDITQGELATLTTLNALGRGITNIAGIENCVNLTELYLHTNLISDISTLSSLTSLTKLWLNDNQISDITALASLTNLTHLYLHNNQISDITALSSLPILNELQAYSNQISDITALSSLTSLIDLHISYNQISDISALSSLINLNYLTLQYNQISEISALTNLPSLLELYLHNNQISDITALVENSGFGVGDYIILLNNNLDLLEGSEDLEAIVALESRGVLVAHDTIQTVAAFSSSPTSGVAPLDVQFTDQSTGDIDSWDWDFGDGGTSTEQNPLHTYTASEIYTVSLTTTNPIGSDTQTKVDHIIVLPDQGWQAGLSASGTDSGHGDVTNWAGFSSNASEEFDLLDAPEPPPPPDIFVSLYFPHDGWPVHPEDYSVDIRPPTDTMTWDFEVNTSSSEEVTLTWDISEIPAIYSMVILRDTKNTPDMSDDEVVDMRVSSEYIFTSTASLPRELQFVVSAPVLASTTLSLGWNMIALPVAPQNSDFNALLGDDIPVSLFVFHYDPAAGGYKMWSAQSPLFAAEQGCGYWVKVSDPTEINVVGLPAIAGNFTIHLLSGWNMVGHPFDFSVDWGNAQVSYEGSTVSISDAHVNGWVLKYAYGYDTGAGGYNMMTAPDGQLDPWCGYWLRAEVECDLIIPNTPMP